VEVSPKPEIQTLLYGLHAKMKKMEIRIEMSVAMVLTQELAEMA